MSQLIPPPAGLAPSKIVWAYLRDSGGDGQEKSVTQQESIIREYCNRHGLILARVFADVARSGKSVEKRAEFLAMIDATKPLEGSKTPQEARPAGILVWNMARFTRDVDDADFYKSTLRKRGIVIHSLTDQIPSGTFGPVVEKLIDVANEEYRRQNSQAVKRALRDLVKEGYAPGGHLAPRGYKVVKVVTGQKRDGTPRTASKWEPDPDLAPLVTLAFKMRAAGKSYREIIKATDGKLYQAVSSWPTFFENRSYLGIGKCGCEEFPEHHEALTDLETFEAAQAFQRLHPRHGMSHPRRIAYPSVLGGLAFCSKCGALMVYHAARHKDWPFYICSKRDRNRYKRECDTRRVNARLVDSTVFDLVLSRILTPEYFDALLQDTRRNLADTESIDRAITEKTEAIRQARQAMSNLLELVETFGPGAALERYQRREAEEARLKFDLQELKAQREALDVEVTPEALALVLETWRNEITDAKATGDAGSLRALLARFIDRIELDYTTLKIWYTFPTDSLCPSGIDAARGGTPFIGRMAVTLDWRN